MQWIKEIVNGLIELFNTRNIYELIDCLGIILIRRELPLNVKGKFLRDVLGNEYIFVSPNLEKQEEKYILAHELGHAILHTDLSIEFLFETLQIKNKFEIQANKFAAEFLISDNLDVHEFEDMTSKEISSYLEVCEELVEYKFKI